MGWGRRVCSENTELILISRVVTMFPSNDLLPVPRSQYKTLAFEKKKKKGFIGMSTGKEARLKSVSPLRVWGGS